jgi:molybdenum cofactor biosynthesis enzyme
MTRRERIEARLERRQEWATKRASKANTAFNAAHKLADGIPLGQPILVGHHSERHARRDAERISNGMSRGCEHSKMADEHTSKARGLAIQLDRTVFSDDPNAIEALEARITVNETKASLYTAINKAWRKGGRDAVAAVAGDKIADRAAETMGQCPYLKGPLDTTNLRARIRADKDRIKQVMTQQARTAEAEAAGGVVVNVVGEYARVTFAEKPEREVIDALKAAGFMWSGGSWTGKAVSLPKELR